ncbi:MAG TPA: glycosyltransferase family 4 protein [bacterium]|nr:glycosyltransferase family 4 protein [bacterium]HPN42382.1 glycosyltransferase family 4 protein [bacterium]
MHILFINSIQMFAGGEVWMLRTLDGLRKRGHRVYLICRPGTELEQRARRQGFAVTTITMKNDYDLLAIYRTWKFIRKHRIQVMLTNMDRELRFGSIAARLAGHCAVIPRRGIDYPLKNRLQYRLSWQILADRAIANSAATRQALLRNAPWLDPDKIHVIYNGIDPAPFMAPADRELRSEWTTDPAAKIIGFAGQLDERKGIHDLLPAFKQVAEKWPNVHLVLAGEGPLRQYIVDYCHENGLVERVHLPGFLSPITDFMKAIDYLVLPSLWEGFGIVLIEAMATGKPVITTNVSSMPEIVQHNKTGLVVPVQNAAALANAFTALLLNPRQAAQWGENGRQRVLKMFTIDRMLDKLEALFRLAVKNRN